MFRNLKLKLSQDYIKLHFQLVEPALLFGHKNMHVILL